MRVSHRNRRAIVAHGFGRKKFHHFFTAGGPKFLCPNISLNFPLVWTAFDLLRRMKSTFVQQFDGSCSKIQHKEIRR